MGIQTVVLFGIVLISVVNICMASVTYDATGNPKMMWHDPTTSTDFLAKAQEIAAAKMNKGFEMKKEGMKIAQQSMMNKFAMFGADEKKKAAAEPQSTDVLGADESKKATTEPPTTGKITSDQND